MMNFYKNSTIYNGDFDTLTHLSSKLVILKREIINGVIIHDIFEILKKICSNSELKEIMDLHVNTAVF